jgi:TolB protein
MERIGVLWRTALAICALLLGAVTVIRTFAQTDTSVGIFESHADVGTVLHPGSVAYDAGRETYTIAGSGNNMWLSEDDFQFVWKKVTGDVTLTADISFLGAGGNPHRKAVLMVRQSLDANSIYADAALHGVGLTSLQFRDEKGAATHEVQANVSAPKRLRIEKHGDYFYMFVGDGDQLQMAAGSPRIALQGPFYVGIGVCSHDKNVVEKAVFSNVDLQVKSATNSAAATRSKLYSTLEVVPVDSGDRRAVYATAGHIEAPNWTRDGKWLLFNREGHIMRLAANGAGAPETIDTGSINRVNNDHGISFDGRWLAISDESQAHHDSLIYIVPLEGGTPRRVTENGPSYWHGWSPDGKTLAFCGERDGEFDVYTIPAAGGEETRLTTAKGLDDGPEYSPDGQYIYFNSVRTALMQIWRMRPDGSEQEQVFSDDYNNWFPHISPDGKWMVFLTYDKSVNGHPANQDVMLRLMSLADKKITVLARLFGGQGTINVPSWSPDSKELAFVSYELVPEP